MTLRADPPAYATRIIQAVVKNVEAVIVNPLGTLTQ
jgi:hypothetical protein